MGKGKEKFPNNSFLDSRIKEKRLLNLLQCKWNEKSKNKTQPIPCRFGIFLEEVERLPFIVSGNTEYHV